MRNRFILLLLQIYKPMEAVTRNYKIVTKEGLSNGVATS